MTVLRGALTALFLSSKKALLAPHKTPSRGRSVCAITTGYPPHEFKFGEYRPRLFPSQACGERNLVTAAEAAQRDRVERATVRSRLAIRRTREQLFCGADNPHEFTQLVAAGYKCGAVVANESVATSGGRTGDGSGDCSEVSSELGRVPSRVQ